jgi:hypothetical protein
MARSPLVVWYSLLALLVQACTAGGSSSAPSAPAQKPAETPKAAPPPPVPCVLDVSTPGPMRRAGRAHVRLAGQGLAVDTEVAGLCGPLFNRDVDALGVKAGEGLLFEACVPEGYVQLTSRERAAGAQHMHHGALQTGTMDVSFNRVGGATYSSHGLPNDRVTLSADFWKAEAELVLRDLDVSSELKASIRFDCSAEPAVAAPTGGASPAPMGGH